MRGRFESTRRNYITAGIVSAAQQILFTAYDLDAFKLKREPVFFGGIMQMMNNATRKTKFALALTMTAAQHSVTLVEMQAYPILLALSMEDAELIAQKLESEREHLSILEGLLMVLAALSPLAWMSYGNFVDSFKAQMECHQRVLDHYHESWSWGYVKVQEVIDGDTIYVYDLTESVRFMGIDCPEIWHTGDPGKPGDERYRAGRKATEYTTTRLLEEYITIKLYTKRDIYGRRLAKIYIGGKSFETELVREGHAKFKYYG